MDARELILQDVRCFQDGQRGRLRPITLLVGENSTGKTTFLGCYRVLHGMFSNPGIGEFLDFNGEPFVMGSFRDIVRSRRGPSGRIDEFKIGVRVDRSPDDVMSPCELSVAFREKGSEPVVSSLRFQFDSDAFLEMSSDEEGTIVQIPGITEHAKGVPLVRTMAMLDFVIRDPDFWGMPPGWSNLETSFEYLHGLFFRRGAAKRKHTELQWPFDDELPRLPDLIPVAPLRSKPKRTYDPIRETASPEGEHVPMLMMRLDRTDTPHWKSLHNDLVKFGQGSGLFADIKVKRHGKQMSDPFQLQVKVRSGPHSNLMDVGYGVSQSLPILVDVLKGSGSGRKCEFLLQQPEVHLHPRGQAELASLFVQAFKQSGNRFLIETHSDYIIDRVRISVRTGLLKPDDVSLLYFEPKSNAVEIHNMTLDEHGNLLGAPRGYRDFFLKETDRLLGFAD